MGDKSAQSRYTTYKACLGPAISQGFLRPGSWIREPPGRIRMMDPPMQQIANTLRPHFSAAPGHVLIDADYSSAHVAIAAALSGDRLLGAALASGIDIYTELADTIFPGVPDRRRVRKAMKLASLAAINGAGLVAVRDMHGRYVLGIAKAREVDAVVQFFTDVVGLQRAMVLAPLFTAQWWGAFPELRRYRDHIFGLWAARPGGTFIGDSRMGRPLTVDTKPKGSRGWKTLLSACWSSVEADLLDHVLGHLHGTIGSLGGGLVAPMYDGVLVEAPVNEAVLVGDRLGGLLAEAASRAGIPHLGVDVETRSTWG